MITRTTATFTGDEMVLPDGNVIAPTGKAFDVEFGQTSKWDGDQLVEISAFWEKLAASGLDSREYSILSILDTDGPGSQQELARLLGKAPAIVVAAIDDLEERGLVTRTRDPADRRRSRVTVTKAGSKALSHADKLAEAAVAELFTGLDAGELRQLQDLLARGLRPMIDSGPPALVGPRA